MFGQREPIGQVLGILACQTGQRRVCGGPALRGGADKLPVLQCELTIGWPLGVERAQPGNRLRGPAGLGEQTRLAQLGLVRPIEPQQRFDAFNLGILWIGLAQLVQRGACRVSRTGAQFQLGPDGESGRVSRRHHRQALQGFARKIGSIAQHPHARALDQRPDLRRIGAQGGPREQDAGTDAGECEDDHEPGHCRYPVQWPTLWRRFATCRNARPSATPKTTAKTTNSSPKTTGWPEAWYQTTVHSGKVPTL